MEGICYVSQQHVGYPAVCYLIPVDAVWQTMLNLVAKIVVQIYHVKATVQCDLQVVKHGCLGSCADKSHVTYYQ